MQFLRLHPSKCLLASRNAMLKMIIQRNESKSSLLLPWLLLRWSGKYGNGFQVIQASTYGLLIGLPAHSSCSVDELALSEWIRITCEWWGLACTCLRTLYRVCSEISSKGIRSRRHWLKRPSLRLLLLWLLLLWLLLIR